MQTPEEFVRESKYPESAFVALIRARDAEWQARDAEIRRECADRAEKWLAERTSTIDPELMATNSGKWLMKLRAKQTAQLRAAIKGVG